MLWLSIYLPLLPLEVFNHSKPLSEAGLSDSAINNDIERPLVISVRHKVLLCNRAASQCGIEPGVAINTARGLSDTLLIAERDPQKEQRLLQHLAESVYQFSSAVSCYNNHRSENSLLLEIGGSLRLFNGRQQLKQNISEILHQHPLNRPSGFQHQLSIANTPKAAELLARYQYRQQQSSNKSPANKKNINKNARGSDQLSAIPIGLLDLAEQSLSQCLDMGITQLEQLRRIPAAALGKRLGKEIVLYLEQLSGKRADPQRLIMLPAYFEREQFYIDGLRSHTDLMYPIKYLLSELCAYLQVRQLQCRGMQWCFHRFSRQKNTIAIHCSEALNDYQALLTLITIKLDQLPLDSPVETVTLKVTDFEQSHVVVDDFFDQKNPSRNIHLLADKLTAKLGPQALTTIVLHNDHFPEASNRPHQFQQGQSKHDLQHNSLPPRPSWLLPAPEQLFCIDSDIYYKSHKLLLLKGPERIEGKWWTNSGASRDYFVAARKKSANNSAAQNHYQAFYWIYYDRKIQQWYLHGLFS